MNMRQDEGKSTANSKIIANKQSKSIQVVEVKSSPSKINEKDSFKENKYYVASYFTCGCKGESRISFDCDSIRRVEKIEENIYMYIHLSTRLLRHLLVP